ncbi:MAG: hypothetical protein PHQ54_00370 [Candidatus Omnitrophica bacterium]|nr:hypothetical protein [Candidatus Omnitrophota bacterium]
MKNRLLILAVILASGFLFGIYFIGTPNLKIPDISDIKKMLDSEAEVKLSSGVDEVRINKRPAEWSRDPFGFSSKAGFDGGIVLEAILISQGGAKTAMINGEIYREGGVVGAYRIERIENDYIIINEGGNNLMIKLEKGDRE